MNDPITDEMIMALADGQLSEPEAQRVRAAIDASPALQAQLATYEDSRRILVEGFKGLLEKPVPAAMEQLVLAKPKDVGGVVSLAGERAKRKPGFQFDFLPQAAAAAVLVTAAGLGGFHVGQSGNGSSELMLAGLVPGKSELAAALNTAAAGAAVDVEQSKFVAIATFAASNGQACREFELSSENGAGTVGLACRIGVDWQIEVAALNTAPNSSEQVVPASADAFELVGVALDAKGGYETIDPSAEACFLNPENCSPQP